MKLYSIVVTHYNQMEFIYEALDSVFKQNYPNIELIVTDDKSKSFDKKTVIDYIEKKKKKNITNYIIIANDTNLGTTKTFEILSYFVQLRIAKVKTTFCLCENSTLYIP